jgi:hypothetical protein
MLQLSPRVTAREVGVVKAAGGGATAPAPTLKRLGTRWQQGQMRSLPK